MKRPVSITPLLDLLLVVLFVSFIRASGLEASKREEAEDLARARAELQEELRGQNTELAAALDRRNEEIDELNAKIDRLQGRLDEARQHTAAELDLARAQMQSSEKALQALIKDSISGAPATDRQMLEGLFSEIEAAEGASRLRDALEATDVVGAEGAKAIARRILLSMEYERVCDLWQLRVLSNTEIELLKGSESVVRHTFDSERTPPEVLVKEIIEGVRNQREAGGKPAVLWIEYDGEDPLLIFTLLYIRKLKDTLVTDIRNELQGQKLIVADKL